AEYKRLKGVVARLALAHRTVPAIEKALDVEAERLGIAARPDAKTIRRWLKELRTGDTSGSWVPLASPDPGQAARVLPVLAEAVRTGGLELWLTDDQADLIDRIVLAVSTIPPSWALPLGLGFQWALANGCDTRGLDLTLALKPWESV